MIGQMTQAQRDYLLERMPKTGRSRE